MAALQKGLVPFVEQNLRRRIGPGWAARLDRGRAHPLERLPQGGVRWDTSALLRTMADNWGSVFGKMLGPSERAWVGELRAVRNDDAHEKPFDTERTLRSLDTARLLLTSVGAASQAKTVDAMLQEMREEQMRELLEQRSATVAASAKPPPNPAHGSIPTPLSSARRYSFTLLGTTHFRRTRRAVLIDVFCALVRRDPGFLERAAQVLGGRVRPYLSRDREEVIRGRAWTVLPAELPGGWWIRTQFNADNMRRRLQTAAEVAELTWGEDLIVNLG